MALLGGSYTLRQFIESGKKVSISYDKFSTIQTVDNIKFPVFNILNDYLDELKSLSVEVELSDAEYNLYVYRPKLLAFDIYGSTELDFVLLAINGLADEKDFHFDNKKIKALRKSTLVSVLSSIYNTERQFINENRN